MIEKIVCTGAVCAAISPLVPALCGMPVIAAPPETVAPASATMLEGIDGPRGLLLLHPGQKETLTYRIKHTGSEPLPAAYTYILTDREGREVGKGSGKTMLASGAVTPVPVAINTAGFRLGVYYLQFRLNAQAAENAGTALIERESYVGVSSSTKLPKAKTGEFLYGLDVALWGPDADSPLFTWAEVMGVDIVRGGLGWQGNPDEVTKRISLYDRKNLAVLMMVDPPKNGNAAERKKALAGRVRNVEQIARQYPQLKYWEMGNEPDLPFFYPGPIEEYAEAYGEMYRAVKRGNKNTVVMNGGLCFAGDEAKVRARRFVEVVDPATIDAWAYHGHGVGANAERGALETMRRTAREFNKHDKPYAETESGVAARTRAQEEMQARTAVQKLVYAQSEKLPLFMWFRLLMFEEDYGNLADRAGREPRPAVLSYRATVEALRSHRYARALNIGKPDISAYLFADPSGTSRACALWSDRLATRMATVTLASRRGAVRNLRVLDKYGNASPLTVSPTGSVQVTVTQEPVFVKWNTNEPGFAVSVPKPVLNTAPDAQLVLGKKNAVGVTIRNPYPDKPFVGELVTQATGASISPATHRVSLAPGAKQSLSLSLRPVVSGAVRWPRQWSVFPNVDLAKANLGKIDDLPATLPSESGGAVNAVRVAPRGDMIDFVDAGGTRREKAAGVVIGEVFSDADRTVTFGGSADWWMTWYVNGVRVYDTSDRGNGGGYAVTDHTFPVSLKKGRNLVAVSVLSGSHGWKLLTGSPDALKRTQAPAQSAQMRLVLREGAKGAKSATVLQETVSLHYIAPIAPPTGTLSWQSPLESWEQQEPTGVLDTNGLSNFYEKQPDSSRWWKGASDLSAATWLQGDADRLYVVVRVKDDTYVPTKNTAELWRGDSVQIGIAQPGGSGFTEYTVALINDKPVVFKQSRTGGAATGLVPVTGGEVEAAVEKNGAGQMVYRLSLERKASAGTGEYFVNVAVNDSDVAGTRKQAVQWQPGMIESKDPSLWYRVIHTGAGE